ncbi:MAG: hypothetical protein NVSMB3_02770 [Acidobacteriaceae bacterium]
MTLYLSWQQISLRIALAVLASFCIGLNRDEHGKTAGIRTTMLVCLAATLAMIEANLLINTVGKTPTSFIQLDVMRLPLGILSGIGFIGAGAILRRGNLVRGLTTAATLWIVTILGLLFGAGLLRLGSAASLLTFVILWLLKRLESYIPTVRTATLLVELNPAAAEGGLTEQTLRQVLKQEGFRITAWNVHFVAAQARTIECGLRWFRKGHRQPVTPPGIEQLAAMPGVSRLSWKA